MRGEGNNAIILQAENSSKHEVNGFSVINHYVRLQLGLNLQEYIFLDYIFHTNKKRLKAPISFLDYYKGTGIVPKDISELIENLKRKNLLVWDSSYATVNKHGKKGRVDVCEWWKYSFNDKDMIKQLRKIHRYGNKKTIEERLPKVIQKIPFEELKAKLIAYMEWCTKTGTYAKNLSTWLNPKREHWNDELEDRAPKEEQNNDVPDNFFT
jgi:hypothetical protein